MAVIDPVLGQALSILAGAVAMAIVSIVSYYFPKGHDRFDLREQKEQKDEQEGGEAMSSTIIAVAVGVLLALFIAYVLVKVL